MRLSFIMRLLSLRPYVSSIYMYATNAVSDKTEMLMNLKKQNAINRNRILSRNIEYKKNFKKKN